MKVRFVTLFMGVALLTIAACTGKKSSEGTACCADKTTCVKQSNNNNKSNCMVLKGYKKKYTNADYYTDGKFNEKVALEAYKDMFEFYGIPFTSFMEKEMWVIDFGLGDFENVGMGGVFWVNDLEHNYFAHEIYLLPNQMIAEHAHVKTEHAPKFESWMVQKGMAYNFSTEGDATPNPPALPESQKSMIKSKNFTVQEVGDILHLKKIETFHFLFAGPDGAVISEWASYHDGKGLRFTNPKAKL